MQIDGRKNNGPREGIRNGGSPRKITDDELREACKVMSRMEIAKKYDMHPESLARRMHRLGVHALYVRQDGTSVYRNNGNAGPRKPREPLGWHYTKGAARVVQEKQPGFEYVATNGKRIKMICKGCGEEIVRTWGGVSKCKTTCPTCKEISDLRQSLVSILKKAVTKNTPHICPECGGTFFSETDSAIYCSKKCKRKHRGSASIRGRCRKYRTPYQTGITLPQLYRRDGGICQICGKPTDWNDKGWTDFLGPMHPTIDHKIALANGGGHTWDNVQLAHAICNSYKRDT